MDSAYSDIHKARLDGLVVCASLTWTTGDYRARWEFAALQLPVPGMVACRARKTYLVHYVPLYVHVLGRVGDVCDFLTPGILLWQSETD